MFSAVSHFQIENITEEDLAIANLDEIEADIYWCLSHFLTNIQDHYAYAQPGIQKMLFQLNAFIERLERMKYTIRSSVSSLAKLAHHLQTEGVDYMQFAFKWINCIFTRELALPV